MLSKTWNPDQELFDVVFDLPSALEIDRAAVVGEFNDWDPDADPMTKDADGRWVATVSLEPGTTYRFRYHLGGDRWENDWSADDYADNEFGGADSVVRVPDAPSEPPAVKGTSATSTRGTEKAPAEKKAPAKKAAKKAAAKKKTGTKNAATKKAGAKKTTKKATKKSAPGSGAE